MNRNIQNIQAELQKDHLNGPLNSENSTKLIGHHRHEEDDDDSIEHIAILSSN